MRAATIPQEVAVAGVATDLVGQGPLMTRNNLMLGDIPIRKAPG